MFRRLINLALITFVLSGCGPVGEHQAESAAADGFNRTCSNLHLQPSDFAGPFWTTVGNTAFAYEWHTKNPAGLGIAPAKIYGILISVTASGDTEVALLDRPIAS